MKSKVLHYSYHYHSKQFYANHIVNSDNEYEKLDQTLSANINFSPFLLTPIVIHIFFPAFLHDIIAPLHTRLILLSNYMCSTRQGKIP